MTDQVNSFFVFDLTSVFVFDWQCRNGFALVRPPGHHAMANEMNGFCLFNNVVITAKTAIEKYNLQRYKLDR